MELFANIGLIIVTIIYIIGCISALYNGILFFIPVIKCRKVRNCKKDDCPFRSGCRYTAYSDKEKDRIRSEINSLK